MKAATGIVNGVLIGVSLWGLIVLGGCAALPMALSAAAGALTIAKDVLDLDVSLRQATPGKTPIGAVVPIVPVPPERR